MKLNTKDLATAPVRCPRSTVNPAPSLRVPVNDDDIKAIYAYLRTVPPVSNTVPAPLGPKGEAGFE